MLPFFILLTFLFAPTNFALANSERYAKNLSVVYPTVEEPVSAKNPNLTLSEEQWNFGTIIQGEKAAHIFKIKNTGDAELIIYNVRTSCGCTATLLSSNNILPGKTAELNVSFNSEGYRDSFTKQVYLSSNDPEEPHKTITISGLIKVLPKITISVTPGNWNVTPAPSGEAALPFEFMIENKGQSPLSVASVETSSNAIKVSASSAEVKPKEFTRLNINIDPKSKSEKMDGYIYLKIAVPVLSTPVPLGQ